MLLVIDVGNTNTAIGIYENKILIENWRIRTVKNITEDEFNVLVIALLSNSKINVSNISQIIISCVVPPMVSILDFFCNKYFGYKPHWVDAKSYKQMPILINNPNELGADRIVNAVAAYNKYMKSLIIVDFGTATTFDCISDQGEYLGGAISPGIIISSEALFNKASKLTHVNIFRPPKNVLGKDTISSVQSGIIFGYSGLVDGIVRRLMLEIGGSPIVLCTGGLASLMFNISETIEKIDPLLTLEGLRIIATDL